MAHSWENGLETGPSQPGLENELLEAIWAENSRVHKAHLKGNWDREGSTRDVWLKYWIKSENVFEDYLKLCFSCKFSSLVMDTRIFEYRYTEDKSEEKIQSQKC